MLGGEIKQEFSFAFFLDIQTDVESMGSELLLVVTVTFHIWLDGMGFDVLETDSVHYNQGE